ncbi:MAG: IS21 family transposase [Candidatus Hydrothermarchaeota archaeon]
MPKSRLSPDDDDFIMNMKRVKYSNYEIGDKLGVSEGTIRYRMKRRQSGREDGRKRKASSLDRFRAVISQWIADYEDSRHRPTLKTLCYWLRRDHGYEQSYDAFRRYIRKHFPEFHKKGARIRIETPPGALMFVDWKEDVLVQMGELGRWVKVQGLCFTLGFSREPVVRFRVKKDLNAFIHAHQEAFLAFGGLPEVIRTDCLKSAIVQWRGEKSVINESYKRYLSQLGIKVFPARPATPEDKGKIEKRIRDLFSRMDFKHQVFKDMADLQQKVDRELEKMRKEWRCGATGLSVAESFEYEKHYLKPLPESFPQFPLRELRTRVRHDGTVYFDGNYYQVHRDYRDRSVLCINTGEEIAIYHDGSEIERHPYLPEAKGMVVLSEKALQDPTLYLSDTVRQWALEVARRQLEIYQEIIHRRSL